MSSPHNTTLNFSHSPYKNNSFSKEMDLQIKMGELRLRYVKLMRDIHTSLDEKEATHLIKESVDIWEKLYDQKN